MANTIAGLVVGSWGLYLILWGFWMLLMGVMLPVFLVSVMRSAKRMSSALEAIAEKPSGAAPNWQPGHAERQLADRLTARTAS